MASNAADPFAHDIASKMSGFGALDALSGAAGQGQDAIIALLMRLGVIPPPPSTALPPELSGAFTGGAQGVPQRSLKSRMMR